MYRPSTYLEVVYFPTYLSIYETYFLQKRLTTWNKIINLVEVHPQLSNNGHPVDGVLVHCHRMFFLRFHNWLEQALLQSMSLALRSSFTWSSSHWSLRSYFDKKLFLKPICDWQRKNHSLIRANIECIQTQVHPWRWHGLKT
jgi:hypothetical protein